MIYIIHITLAILAGCSKSSTALDISKQELEAKDFLANMDAEFVRQTNIQYQSAWEYATNITDENESRKNKIDVEMAKFSREIAEKLQQYNWREFKDDDVRRMCNKLTKLGLAVLPKAEYIKANENLSKMKSFYAKAKGCSYTNRTKCDLPLEPELEEFISKIRKPEELKHYWTEWYNNFAKLKPNYIKYVDYNKKAALLNNYTSQAEEWLSEYEDPTIEQQLSEIMKDLKPLYENLHAYVRYRLKQFYGEDIVPSKGPIPMHLCGNMWCQTLSDISDIVSPFPHKTLIDVTVEMQKQNYTPELIFEMGDNFFQSINMTKLPSSFWSKSLLKKPDDGRELICHASAWDFYAKNNNDNDVRIKQCTLVNGDHFTTVHHELGHIQYYLQYANQPYAFRDGANPGFHEAVGDVIALSASTPKHLEKIGLLKNYILDEETRINKLFTTALDKIFFLPFAYSLDKYRWSIFRGEIKPENWNCAFWKLREELSGIEPPVERSESHFDAGAKYHISGDTEYARYLVSFIIQFQFYKAACEKAGQYEYGNPELPLDNCDFYGNANAGNAFKAMLSLGGSKPWPDAMEVFTGQRKMSAEALKEYFEPLEKWLKAENTRLNVHVGWETSNKCVNAADKKE